MPQASLAGAPEGLLPFQAVDAIEPSLHLLGTSEDCQSATISNSNDLASEIGDRGPAAKAAAGEGETNQWPGHSRLLLGRGYPTVVGCGLKVLCGGRGTEKIQEPK